MGHLSTRRQDLQARLPSLVTAVQQPRKPGFALVVPGSSFPGPTASDIQGVHVSGTAEPCV